MSLCANQSISILSKEKSVFFFYLIQQKFFIFSLKFEFKSFKVKLFIIKFIIYKIKSNWLVFGSHFFLNSHAFSHFVKIRIKFGSYATKMMIKGTIIGHTFNWIAQKLRFFFFFIRKCFFELLIWFKSCDKIISRIYIEIIFPKNS